MITIKAVSSNVLFSITFYNDRNIAFSRNVEDQTYAELLSDRINNDLNKRIAEIREEAYNLGWKDKASKKARKRTTFFGSIQTNSVGY